MLVGHFAISLAAKRIEPKVSLGTLILAAMLPDLLWPVFTLAGLEYKTESPHLMDIPYSHSLLMVTIWGAIFAAGYFLKHHDKKSALLVLGCVLSHWLLDAISSGTCISSGITNSCWIAPVEFFSSNNCRRRRTVVDYYLCLRTRNTAY